MSLKNTLITLSKFTYTTDFYVLYMKIYYNFHELVPKSMVYSIENWKQQITKSKKMSLTKIL